MRVALVTFCVPPFDYRSPWWWALDNLNELETTFDLVAPSDIDQFRRKEHDVGTSHRLNIFADQETEWTERERVEFSVKTYVYLSKLQKRESYDRIVVADCESAEPLIVGNLSVLAPVWVQVPPRDDSPRGSHAAGLLQDAEKRFRLRDLAPSSFDNEWPPDPSDWQSILRELTS